MGGGGGVYEHHSYCGNDMRCPNTTGSLFAQHAVQEVDASRVVTNIHAFGDVTMPQTLVFTAFLPLYKILCKYVEQDSLSQASEPLATMPKALAFTACFASLCTCKDVEQDVLSQAYKALTVFCRKCQAGQSFAWSLPENAVVV